LYSSFVTGSNTFSSPLDFLVSFGYLFITLFPLEEKREELLHPITRKDNNKNGMIVFILYYNKEAALIIAVSVLNLFSAKL
jgi:hypothetical protein